MLELVAGIVFAIVSVLAVAAGTGKMVENDKYKKPLEPVEIGVSKYSESFPAHEYGEEIKTKKLNESADLYRKLVGVIDPEPAENIVIDIMDEAYKKKEDAVELLKRRADDYFGKERRINQYTTERTHQGMLGIFAEMTENPGEYFGYKKISLGEKLENAFHDLDIAQKDQESIRYYLQILKNVDEPSYEHSIRVGLKSAEIAKHSGLNPKTGLFTGTLHDVGKSRIKREILRKKRGFNDADMEIMKNHAKYTYDILNEEHAFSAEVGIRHHRFQGKKSYPGNLPEPKVPFSDDTMDLIEKYARVVALADNIDAMRTRDNDKFGTNERLSAEKAKGELLERNPDKEELIEKLYKNGVFDEDSE